MSCSIEHVTIRCRDIEATIEWFRRMFGARVLLRREIAESRKIVYLAIGESMLELMYLGPAAEPVDSRAHYGAHHFGIKVDDFETVYQDLKAKGAEFLGEPFESVPGIRLVFLREPNGAVIELAKRDPKVFQDAIDKGTVTW